MKLFAVLLCLIPLIAARGIMPNNNLNYNHPNVSPVQLQPKLETESELTAEIEMETEMETDPEAEAGVDLEDFFKNVADKILNSINEDTEFVSEDSNENESEEIIYDVAMNMVPDYESKSRYNPNIQDNQDKEEISTDDFVAEDSLETESIFVPTFDRIFVESLIYTDLDLMSDEETDDDLEAIIDDEFDSKNETEDSNVNEFNHESNETTNRDNIYILLDYLAKAILKDIKNSDFNFEDFLEDIDEVPELFGETESQNDTMEEGNFVNIFKLFGAGHLDEVSFETDSNDETNSDEDDEEVIIIPLGLDNVEVLPSAPSHPNSEEEEADLAKSFFYNIASLPSLSEEKQLEDNNEALSEEVDLTILRTTDHPALFKLFKYNLSPKNSDPFETEEQVITDAPDSFEGKIEFVPYDSEEAKMTSKQTKSQQYLTN